jgi:hypothetical protein
MYAILSAFVLQDTLCMSQCPVSNPTPHRPRDFFTNGEFISRSQFRSDSVVSFETITSFTPLCTTSSQYSVMASAGRSRGRNICAVKRPPGYSPFDNITQQNQFSHYQRMSDAIATFAKTTKSKPFEYSPCNWGWEPAWIWGHRLGQS